MTSSVAGQSSDVALGGLDAAIEERLARTTRSLLSYLTSLRNDPGLKTADLERLWRTGRSSAGLRAWSEGVYAGAWEILAPAVKGCQIDAERNLGLGVGAPPKGTPRLPSGSRPDRGGRSAPVHF